MVWLIEHNDLALSDSDTAPDVLDSDADSLTDEFTDEPPLLEVCICLGVYWIRVRLVILSPYRLSSFVLKLVVCVYVCIYPVTFI